MGVLMDLLDFGSKLCQKLSLSSTRKALERMWCPMQLCHSQNHRNFKAFFGVGGQGGALQKCMLSPFLLTAPSSQSKSYDNSLRLAILSSFKARPAVHNDKMIAEICLDWANNITDLCRGVEANFVESWHHPAWRICVKHSKSYVKLCKTS